MLVWTLGLVKRYQHNHFRCGRLQTRTWLEPSQVFGLSFRAGLVGGVVIALCGITAAVLAPSAHQGGGWLGLAGVVLVIVLAYTWVHCAFNAGLQNMAWSRTASEETLFKSDVQTTALFRLTLKNWLLTALTLSLYRPFAAVATARLRLQAVSVETSLDLDALTGAEAAADVNAAGDFAGDFFGIDLGL